MSGNNKNNNATVTTTVTTRSSKWLVWIPALSDLLIVVCLSVWCAISSQKYSYWKDECPGRYNYDSSASDTCLYVRECDASINCRIDPNLHWISGSLDAGEDCDGFQCGGDECSCEISGSWEGLYISYMILFGFSAIGEAFKALLVLSAAMTSGCDPSENEPIEASPLQTCMDSWTLILLRITLPRRFDQLMQANDEGKVPVVTKPKLAQWAYRDFGCGLILTLYPLKVHFYNAWQIVFIVAIVIYVLSLWQRSIWVESQSSKMRMLNQPPIVAMVEIHHQQQLDSQPNVTNANAEGS